MPPNTSGLRARLLTRCNVEMVDSDQQGSALVPPNVDILQHWIQIEGVAAILGA